MYASALIVLFCNKVRLINLFLYFAAWLNRTRIYNNEILASIIDTKPQHIPLLTLSNHHSCFDDPGIWGKCYKISFPFMHAI